MATASPDNDSLPYCAQLPLALYRAEQVRELDRRAIEEHGIPGIHLMKRAARAAFTALLEQWPEPEQITVFCGAGNNAGDGYIVAGLAAQRRIPVSVVWASDPDRLHGDARLAYEFARREGVIMLPLAEAEILSGGVVVDALLGTGASGEVREHYAAAIELIRASGLPVVALDLPSGLCADTGRELGQAVRADLTVTFIGVKPGLLTGRGPALTGRLLFADLAIVPEVYGGMIPAMERLSLERLLRSLPGRDRDAHKGHFGHVMVVGGDYGFAGAAAMAAEAAARTGAGLTSVATRPEHVTAIVARRPEVMALGVISGQELSRVIERASVLVVGPGLGQSPWSEQLLLQAAETELPVVLDADGLNLLAEGRVLPHQVRDHWVLTPHPGEAARLLGVSVQDVQQDRFAAACALQKRFGGVVLLKGAGTVICEPGGELSVAAVGNPGMASGGMGDVLSGVIGALLAQGLDASMAAQLGVCLHGAAADRAAAEFGERGMLATDLFPYLRALLNSDRSDE